MSDLEKNMPYNLEQLSVEDLGYEIDSFDTKEVKNTNCAKVKPGKHSKQINYKDLEQLIEKLDNLEANVNDLKQILNNSIY